VQPPRIGAIFRPQLPPERLRGFVGRCERAGLDDVWLWEDCFAEGGLTTAAAALAWSGSLRVGLGLMPVPLRNPALAAMEVATLARLFPGRFLPVVGHGVQEWMAQVGALPDSPVRLLGEWTAAVRALLHGQPVSVQGEYVRLDGVALEWPPRQVPPLLVGARGPRTLALAGKLADGVVLDAGIGPDGVRRAVELAGAGGRFEVVVYLMAGAGEGARERIDAELARSGHPVPPVVATGTPAQVADVVRGYAAAGATTVAFQPAGADPDMDGLIDLAAAARAALRP
jgi:alkanesulfonate monooxygenase SsuD/methylene tetrahydromethanopterin reductase-like flavin-dependent oxidoreductase (luciferase family)